MDGRKNPQAALRQGQRARWPSTQLGEPCDALWRCARCPPGQL